MKARLLALLVAVLCVLGTVWSLREKLRQTLPMAKSGHVPALQADRNRPEKEVALVPLDHAERSPVARSDAMPNANDVDEEADPVTPEHPGPEQALLRVEVVALETEKPLAGAQLWLSSEDE